MSFLILGSASRIIGNPEIVQTGGGRAVRGSGRLARNEPALEARTARENFPVRFLFEDHHATILGTVRNKHVAGVKLGLSSRIPRS